MSWFWGFIGVYVVGFVWTFVTLAVAVPNLTLALMFFRALVWPIWMITGWPHGTPLIVD